VEDRELAAARRRRRAVPGRGDPERRERDRREDEQRRARSVHGRAILNRRAALDKGGAADDKTVAVIDGKRIAVVMPAYNAEKTLRQTYAEVAREFVDDVILVDDKSSDRTIEVAKELGLHVLAHDKNRGYGGNQKTCYQAAIDRGADVVVMLHPDYQYTPKLLPAMVTPIVYGVFDVMLGSRILGGSALEGGMPLYKYVANRFLTLVENILLGAKLSEYHTGYRAFSRDVLARLPLLENSDDFVFDNQMLAQAIQRRFRIGEVSCPALYFPEASSINFRRSVRYGFGVLGTALAYRLHRWGIRRSRLFADDGARLATKGDAPPHSPAVPAATASA
jgi:glycosyltransferase involved in cell wall biosynthesis